MSEDISDALVSNTSEDIVSHPQSDSLTTAIPQSENTVSSPTETNQQKNSFTRLNWAFRIVFTLASTVGGLSSIAIKQLLLPLQISIISPHNTNTSFAVVASIGALAGLIASPFTLALSDRTVSRWGRRRIWIIAGLIAGILGLAIMTSATTIPVLLVGEIIAQIGVDTILSAVAAVIPDQIPARQRGSFSALNGMAPIVGGVLGLLAVTKLTNTRMPAQGYIVLIAMSIIFVVLFLIFFHDQPVSAENIPPFRIGQFLESFIHPLKSSDFVFTLLSRCLVFLSFQILGAYTLFYLTGALHFKAPVAAAGVANFQLISTGTLLVAALIAGGISGSKTSSGRIKPFVIVGALLMAISLTIIAFVHIWTVMLLTAIVFGAGFGTYLAVDMALAIRVLPTTTDNGKDLAIINTAIFLPLILSPIIGAFVLNLSHNNFELLFAIAALSSIIAAILILPIRRVR
jgi:MFS family permease